MDEIKIERTGNVHSIASSEFKVTYPDGHTGTLWSPPWHEMTEEEESAAAMGEARKRWLLMDHKTEG